MLSHQTPTNPRSGSALPIILLVLVLAAGAGVWFYLQQNPEIPSAETTFPPETGQPASVTVPPADLTAVPETQPIAPAESAPLTDASATPAETGATAAPVTLDVEKIMGVRSLGKPDAPVKIVEYFSLTCSHCAHFHNDVLPALKAKYIDTGKVYLEFREFPLNDPALKAAIAARCLPPERYESFVSLLFKTQDQWSAGLDYMAKLKQNAKLAGLSDEMFDACQNSPDVKVKMATNMQEGQDKWKVSATPTFILNDGKETISGAQPLENFERAFRTLTGDAVGEAPKVE